MKILFMEDTAIFEMLSPWVDHAPQQHGSAVLAAFPIAHGDARTLKVHVLDAPPHRRHQTQSSDLHCRQHHRQARRLLRRCHAIQPGKFGSDQVPDRAGKALRAIR
ncbi:MAG: hypothetical protein WBN86_00590 [Porticoccaceae bacterium]